MARHHARVIVVFCRRQEIIRTSRFGARNLFAHAADRSNAAIQADCPGASDYEAMNVLVAAIESVCAAGGDPADRLAITRAVMATRNFSGALGTWSFDANGDISLTDFTYYQVQGGKFIPIGQFK